MPPRPAGGAPDSERDIVVVPIGPPEVTAALGADVRHTLVLTGVTTGQPAQLIRQG
jgi:hypothetical protein